MKIDFDGVTVGRAKKKGRWDLGKLRLVRVRCYAKDEYVYLSIIGEDGRRMTARLTEREAKRLRKDLKRGCDLAADVVTDSLFDEMAEARTRARTGEDD